MENNLLSLEKKAIDAALKNDWETAVILNTQILNNTQNNLGAKIRLGKALIQTKKFKEAIKMFEEVLEIDPINQIAIKNLAVAKEKKVSQANIQAKQLIIEPGMTTELTIEVNKNIPFEVGQVLTLNIDEDKIYTYYNDKKFAKTNNSDLDKTIKNAILKNINIDCSVIKIKQNKITLLLSSEVPIFKGEKQSVKPYFKKGTIEEEEPELDLGSEQSE